MFYGTFSFYPMATEKHTTLYLQNRKCRSHKDSLKKSLLFILILPALSFLLQPKTFNSLTHEKTTILLHCIFVIMDTTFLRSESRR